MIPKKYSIISVGCNCEKYVRPWFRSVVKQTIKDFECFIALDPSSDDTVNTVYRFIKSDDRFKVVSNSEKENYGALKNRYLCTEHVKNPESIVMHLDLDDSFYTKNSIKIVADTYSKYNCWLTYGSYASNVGGCWNKEIPKEVWANNSHRKNAWSTSSLRTFKKWLWDKIDPKDFLMPDGTWIKRGTDLAFMFPMLEMAGQKRVRFIKNILYYYNVYGQQNKNLLKHENLSVKHTRGKTSYKRIENR